LLELYSRGVRGELIEGALCEVMSVGGQHGEIAAMLIGMLMNVVRPKRLGRITGTDAGVLLDRNPDVVREPDVAFFSVEKLALDAVITGYYEVVPDLAVEIVSPGSTNVESYDKVRMWLSFGVSIVWEVFPSRRSVNVYQLNRPTIILFEDDSRAAATFCPVSVVRCGRFSTCSRNRRKDAASRHVDGFRAAGGGNRLTVGRHAFHPIPHGVLRITHSIIGRSPHSYASGQVRENDPIGPCLAINQYRIFHVISPIQRSWRWNSLLLETPRGDGAM
jgi:Uma2 family endonuclease